MSCTEWPEVEGKDVGSCQALLLDLHHMQVTLDNAYPCYGCTVDFDITNSESIPVVVSNIIVAPQDFTNGVEVTVTVLQVFVGQVLDPGAFVHGQLQAHVEQAAEQNTQYTFNVTVNLVQWTDCGTIGFWKNWDRHNTYSEERIDTWLVDIDAASSWLVEDMDGNGAVDVSDMEAIFERATSSNKAAMRYKFLGHYLATRLDGESGRVDPGVHDFSAYDTGDYLGLGGTGTLEEIFEAIESRHPDPGATPPLPEPAEDQYEIMKNICDALNNAEI